MIQPTKNESKRVNQIKRPERNRKEKTTQAREELRREDVLELMGVHDRGHRRHRGAWRKA